MITVLCLDDHTYQFAKLGEALGAYGYSVVLARDRDGALDTLANTPIQAIILDCQTRDAADFVMTVRMARPSIPILMLSGYCSNPCCLASSADACIQKGETANSVLHALELVIRSARYGLCRSVPHSLSKVIEGPYLSESRTR